MTVDGLFGPIEIAEPKVRQIKFRQIRAVYETLTVAEGAGNYLSPKIRYTSPTQIFDTFSFLQDETKEYFIALHLDGKNRILAVDICSIGSLNQSIVHPREVFKTALLSSAAAIILMHNHPSGDPTPSNEDLVVTRRLREVGDLIGIRILDHIVVGSTYYSFVERGII
jgi:DNA repair protein RadC